MRATHYLAIMAPRWLLLLFLGLTFSGTGSAQLRVEITGIPAYTPGEDSLYLTGSFNDWQPGDERFRFYATRTGELAYDFLTPVPDFTFKVTRGSWPTVEGGPFGGPIANREYVHRGAARDTIRIVVESWEDMVDRIAFLDTLILSVTAIPENTPEDATLYVTGNFNDWSPRDEDYRMRQRPNGTFVATIPLRAEQTDFKITRGSWSSIESRANGLALPNRSYRLKDHEPDRVLSVEVANWEDLAGSPLGWYGLLLLLVALQLLVLGVVLLSLGRSHRLLAILLLVLAVGTVARVGAFDRSVFQAVPKLILLPDLLFFLPAPLVYLYLRSRSGGPRLSVNDWKHFGPLALAVLAYLPLLAMTAQPFTSRIVDGELVTYFGWASITGFGIALGYRVISRGVSVERGFLSQLLLSFTVPLVAWGLTCLSGTLDVLTGLDLQSTTNWLADATWLLLAGVPAVVGYWLIRQPGRFREVAGPPELMSEISHPASPPPPVSAPAEASERVAAPLTELMRRERPYLNAGLTLAELAELAEMPAHQLSRLLNEEFGQSFFDYVNGYRVDHFTEQLRLGAHERQTMLSLGLEAGFNSKSAFNRAFKKKTAMTPRAYLRSLN